MQHFSNKIKAFDAFDKKYKPLGTAQKGSTLIFCRKPVSEKPFDSSSKLVSYSECLCDCNAKMAKMCKCFIKFFKWLVNDDMGRCFARKYKNLLTGTLVGNRILPVILKENFIILVVFRLDCSRVLKVEKISKVKKSLLWCSVTKKFSERTSNLNYKRKLWKTGADFLLKWSVWPLFDPILWNRTKLVKKKITQLKEAWFSCFQCLMSDPKTFCSMTVETSE